MKLEKDNEPEMQDHIKEENGKSRNHQGSEKMKEFARKK